jgi:flagellar protein FlgJ
MEVESGVVQQKQARFRCYDNIASSFDDYANFVLADERYQPAREAGSALSYLTQLSKAGYATDPNYVQKLQRVLNNDALRSSRS